MEIFRRFLENNQSPQLNKLHEHHTKKILYTT